MVIVPPFDDEHVIAGQGTVGMEIVRQQGEPFDAIFADGVAVKQIGAEPFRIARECVDEVVLVTTDKICAAIKDIFEDIQSIAEPAGALGVSGLKRYVEREGVAGRRFATIVSGANVHFDRLRHIAERAELGEHRESLLAVTVPERPGSLLRFCELIGDRSITEFNYRYSHDAHAHIFRGRGDHRSRRRQAGARRRAGE